MKLPEMNQREKNFTVFTIVMCAIILSYGQKQRADRERARVEGAIGEAETRLNEAKKLLEESVAKRMKERPTAVTAATRGPGAITNPVNDLTSLFLLRDISLPEKTENVKIVSSERRGNDYQVIVESQFEELMRFMSFLERGDGKFALKNATISRKEEEKKVQGTFLLAMKG